MQNVSDGKLVLLLQKLEQAGNRLPHPTTLFVYFTALLIPLSALLAATSVSALHPHSGESIAARSLLSQDGLHYILLHTVSNFTGFAPLGTVLVAMLGIGIAEKSGLLSTVLRLLVNKAPDQLLTLVVVFTGVLSSLAADAGYVVLIPLSALLFVTAGRPALAGIAAAFAGVSAGYSANLLVGPLDVILAGITTESVKLVDEQYTVTPLANYYFIIVSTFVISLIATWVTEKIVLPACQNHPQVNIEGISNDALDTNERRGLKFSLITLLVFSVIIIWLTLPENAILRDPDTRSLVKSPFMSGIVTIIALGFAVVAIAFGYGSGTFQKKNSIIEAMEDTMQTMAGYLVLMFFAAQFVSYFGWTNMGAIIAIKGASTLQHLENNALLLLPGFVIVSAMINLFIGSASAKWSIMGPIFVPMLFLLGISPESVQMAYRIGDSTTNIITPLMPYFALVVAFCQRWYPQAGIGTLLAIMLPYSVFLMFGWLLLLVCWVFFQLPLGPGSPTLL
jgi:aminobenzoyl-glutamate transport protein